MKEKVTPYWKDAAKFAREHGIKRLAFETHPNFVVYNPKRCCNCGRLWAKRSAAIAT
jgi:hypothetical protein